MPYTIDHEIIKPKKDGVSDFFNFNIYRYALDMNDSHCRAIRVNLKIGKPDILMLGTLSEDKKSIYGCKLIDILSKKEGEYFTPEKHIIEGSCRDISERFWALYLLHGGCLIDDLFHVYENKPNNTKSCRFCGQTKELIQHPNKGNLYWNISERKIPSLGSL